MKKIRLGVNIDHVATVRNARGEKYPSPLRAAILAEKYGADSITIHLREDRRHINDNDLKLINSRLKIPLNLDFKKSFLQEIILKLKRKKIRVSLFIEPSLSDIKKAKLLNADCIEIHTGRFCNLVNQNKSFKNELNKIKKAVVLGNKIGLEVHAGHGLTYKSARALSKTKGIKEFNIGHFLIGDSIFVGLANSVKQFKKIIK